MQDKKLINITHAVVGEQGVYSIEFHEDNHTTHVKRTNSDTSETLFSIGGSSGSTDYISDVQLNGSSLDFTATGSGFSGSVSLSSLVAAEENNIVAYQGGTINTDTVSSYSLRNGAEKITLARTVASDTDFIFRGGTSVLGTTSYGIITVYVTISCSGTGGIRVQYEDLNGSNVNVAGSTPQLTGNLAITFSYFGATGLQLLAVTEA